jgi:type I restriction enzyme S subunit
MSEWKEYKLSDFIEINPKVTLKSGSKHSFVEMKDLSESQKFVLPSQLKDISGGARFQNFDTLFARITPCLQNGKICQVKGLTNSIGFGSTEFLVFRGKEGISNTDFVYYLSRYQVVRTFAEQNMIGTSGRQRVSKDAFENIELFLPPLPTQTAIAEILSSLDDKIELNNKINQELEALAQTLFKQWFIDFEFPNENGEPYKSSGGEMVESELGEIPKGWEVVELSILLTVKYGKDHKHLSDGIYPLYGSGGIMRYVEKPLYQHDSILIPRKGTLSNLFYLEEPFWSVDTMFYTEIHNPIFGKYLFHCIKAMDIASMNVGSAVPSMTTKVLNELKILNPSDLVIQEFDTALSAFHNSINQNKKETEDLTNLRDTLLPKLISGELELAKTTTLN